MSDAKKSFYLTTPIYYVNARPHIGHAYTTIVADVVARRRRLLGDDVFFLTGTDEHGQKIERAAKAAGISPQAFADSVSIHFRNLWDRMGLTYDKYIRTTDADHMRGVQALFTELQSRGYITLQTYTGQYCVSDETFVDVPVGAPCPDCGRITETVSEENYYFQLSQFQERLIDAINSDELKVQPDTRKNEVLSFLRGNIQAEGAVTATSQSGLTYVPGALKDLSISRSSFDWGIPVPGDPRHVIYVWLDALANYITAVGYGDPARAAEFAHRWPADLHLVGKEISRFHCVYWPAFLMAAGLPLPKQIVAHGWLLFEESKMSKSRGNIVRAETILEAFGSLKPNAPKAEQDLFGADVLRYFLLREIPFGNDGNFSFDALVTRYNADLANGYGNLVSRTLKMIETSFSAQIPSKPIEPYLFRQSGKAWLTDPPMSINDAFLGTRDIQNNFEDLISLQPSSAERTIFDLGGISLRISFVDRYISHTKPWLLAKSSDETDQKKLAEVLYTAAESLRIATAILSPYMPHATAKVWAQLGLGDIETAAKNGELNNLQWGGLTPGIKLGELGPIFPRADKELINRMNELEAANTASTPQADEAAPITAPTAAALNAVSPATDAAAAEAAAHPPVVEEPKPLITIDDFMKVELRVAEIKVAERIPKSDKLLRLEVDLGTEQRQILAGIAEHYDPATLIGRRCIIVANLAPRKMRGLESQGMLLAASLGDGDKPAIASFLDSVALGARVR